MIESLTFENINSSTGEKKEITIPVNEIKYYVRLPEWESKKREAYVLIYLKSGGSTAIFDNECPDCLEKLRGMFVDNNQINDEKDNADIRKYYEIAFIEGYEGTKIKYIIIRAIDEDDAFRRFDELRKQPGKEKWWHIQTVGIDGCSIKDNNIEVVRNRSVID